MKKTRKPVPGTTVQLTDLIGPHVLSGVDKDTTEVKLWGDRFEIAQCIRFTLDGTTYVATEDPEDGYRSTMKDIVVSDRPCAETFPKVKVSGRMKETDEYGQKHNTIQFINLANGKVVLEVGTDNIEDYYPWYVATFNRENL